MARLHVDHLNISYIMKRTGQALEAVEEVTFTVGDGEFVSIVGPSGCGKTSVLHAVAGLVVPDYGLMSLDGQPITGPGRDRAMVFQAPALLPWRTVVRNVAYGLGLQGVATSDSLDRAHR